MKLSPPSLRFQINHDWCVSPAHKSGGHWYEFGSDRRAFGRETKFNLDQSLYFGSVWPDLVHASGSLGYL